MKKVLLIVLFIVIQTLYSVGCAFLHAYGVVEKYSYWMLIGSFEGAFTYGFILYILRRTQWIQKRWLTVSIKKDTNVINKVMK